MQVRTGGQLGKLRLKAINLLAHKPSKSQQMSDLAKTPGCDNRPPSNPGDPLGEMSPSSSLTFLLKGTPQAPVSEQVSAGSYFRDHVVLPLGQDKEFFFFSWFKSKWPFSVI